MAIIDRQAAIIWKYPNLIHSPDGEKDNGDYLVQNRNDETGEEEFYWYTKEVSQPTDEDMQTWTNEQAHLTPRRMAYDNLNQFEMQYDDQVNNTTTWLDAIAKIKLDNPKVE